MADRLENQNKLADSNNTTTKKVEDLKNDVETQNQTKGFDSLEKNFEKNEKTKEFLDLVSTYVDFKLDKSFTDYEKSNIKLIMLGEMQKEMKLNSIMGNITENLLTPLKEIISSFNTDKELGKKTEDISTNISKVGTEFSKFFSSIGLEGKIKTIDSKIEKINLDKKNNKGEFKSLKSVLSIVTGDKESKLTEKEIYENIKSETERGSVLLNKGAEVGEALAKGIEKLPFDLGDGVKGFLKGLAEKFPILGMIFGLLFGKEFLSESGNKADLANNNLSKFYDIDKSPLKDTEIKKEDFKEFKTDTLEKFYIYLDAKDIDYSSDTFWMKLFSGKTDDIKILEIRKLLINKDGKLLGEKNGLNELVGKLNGISAKEKEEGNIISKKAEQTRKEKEDENKKAEQTRKEKEDENKKAKIEAELASKTALASEQSLEKTKNEEKNIKKHLNENKKEQKIIAEKIDNTNDLELKKKLLEKKEELKNKEEENKRKEKEITKRKENEEIKAEKAREDKIKADKIAEKAKEDKVKADKIAEKAREDKVKADKIAELAKPFGMLLKDGKIKIGENLEKISIDENNHILKIGNNRYKIEIIVDLIITKKNVLEKVSFKEGIINIIANGTSKAFRGNDVENLLEELINKGEINKKIKGKSADLIIKKV